jgi:hypothetical protein
MTTVKKLFLPLFSTALFLSLSPAYAWKNEVSFGYGFGNEVERDYANNAYVLSSKLYKFPKIDKMLIATIDGSISRLHAETETHRDLTTVALALGLRAYFQNPDLHKIRPYLGASSGPAYISSRYFGERDQGTNFDLQTTLESGVEFGFKDGRGIDLNLHLVHYCNAGIAKPNQGFNVPFVISIGYQF